MSRRYSLLILSLIILPILIWGIRFSAKFFSRAMGQPANIIVNPIMVEEPLSPFWQALAQGGEEKMPFTNIIPEIKALQPQYIRFDHLYDFYHPARKNDQGQLVFNWTELDAVVADIRRAGALPCFCLSYLPPELTFDGQVTSPPLNWADWSLLVQKTIEHFSGQNQQNLTNIAYEVWNEPDLFGHWQIGQTPDYLKLYHYAAIGAAKAQKVNSFKLGGPATTAVNGNWTGSFLDYVQQNHLKLDFLSWHRYSADPTQFSRDLTQIHQWLNEHHRTEIGRAHV